MGRRKLKTKSRAGVAQKKKQKMEIDDQPSSSSSLANAQVEMENQQPSTSVKIDNGPPESKFKESKSEVEDNCSIEDLPPEMLMKIAKCLDIKSLTCSRLVNRRWNEIAREILQRREDLEVSFECETYTSGKLKSCKKGRKVLSGFVKCFQASKETPLYTRFCFNKIEFPVFDHKDWISFASDFGKSIKCLKLVVKKRMNIQGLEKMTEELRNLLLNQLPNLQEFHLKLPCGYNNQSALKIRLFPKTTTKSKEETAFELPHLKTVYLDGHSFSKHTKIVRDLLRAAVNLQNIELFKWNEFYPEVKTFQLVDSLGKLHCLQNATIRLSFFFYELNRSYTVLMSLKLKKLHLGVNNIFRDKNLWPDSAAFLSHLFESSKNTLTDLTMEPLGFLPQLQLPKFSKLTNLNIFDHGKPNEQQVLPSGFDPTEIFPVLKYLKLVVPWPHFFPNDENVDCLPNLTNLGIDCGEMTAEDVARISQVCPNLKELKLGYVSWRGQNFSQVGTAIWTHLKHLESLELCIKLDTPANAFPAVDSCFTGFSGEDVTRLYDLIENEKSTKKQGSQSEVEMDRQKPSILDLKDLKNLTIKLGTDDMRPGQTISGSVLTKALIVSEKYAFKLMNDLDFKIVDWF